MAASFYDDQKKRNQQFALMQLQAGSDSSPVQHPLQAVARALQGAVGGYQLGALEREDKSQRSEVNSEMAKLLMGGQQAPAPAPAAPADFGGAIAGIESGGKYDALGPVTKSGDRAYGKYQVMGANVPQWTQAHLGQQMTPDQFLANPQAQDAVFKGQFGQYANKYGPEGAARAWFAGEGGMNNLNAKDQLGTTVGQYGQKFAQAAGVPSMPQPAQGGTNPQAIARMLQSSNPYVQQMGQQLAQGVIGQQLKPQTTDEIKEFEYAQRNPNFKVYKTDLKKAGAIQNQVVIDQKGEGAFSTEAGKVQAKRFDEIAGEGQKAKQMVSDIETLRMLGDQIKTGKLAEAKAVLGPYADALNIKVDGLNEIQAFEAIVNRVAPNMRVPGSGAQSDYELRNFLKSMPTLGNTPEGNALIAKTMEGVYQNKVAAAEIASKALNGEIKRPDAEKMLRELPDPLKEWRETMKAQKAAPKPSQSDIEAEMRRRGLLK